MLFYVVKQFFNQMDNRIILNKYAVNYLSKYDTSKKNLEKIFLQRCASKPEKYSSWKGTKEGRHTAAKEARPRKGAYQKNKTFGAII